MTDELKNILEREKYFLESSKKIIDYGIKGGEIGLPEIEEYSRIRGHIDCLDTIRDTFPSDESFEAFIENWRKYLEETHEKMNFLYSDKKIRIYPAQGARH